LAQVLTTKVASRDTTPKSKDQRSRSQGHVTYSLKNCYISVLSGPIKFVIGGNMGTTPGLVLHKVVAMAAPAA